MEKKQIVVAVSGGFDPVHVGHMRMFSEAKKLGDKLVVILNNDNWLKKKKGFAFMPEAERKELIENITWVDEVVLSRHLSDPEDMSVSEDLLNLRPHVFVNGGDRNETNAADPNSSLHKDIQACKKVGIEIVYNVGKGGKVQSSSWLLMHYLENVPCPCGSGKEWKHCHGAP